ncbi:MAG: PilN domain-containing protein [Gammaproteobacteria bacterium]|nr:PilN domain-containing protein [Gammaproteobacteria bacterium]MDH5799966.1 PilN domain-containing protein [Gammaproteobacteria bacterium]
MNMKAESIRMSLNSSRLWGELSRFFRWWLQELEGVFGSLLGAITTSTPGIEVQPQHDGWIFEVRRGVTQGAKPNLFLDSLQSTRNQQQLLDWMAEQGIAAAPSGSSGYCLRPSADHCLVKSISWPAAVAQNLDQVISYEMDRHTPFSADQVYYDYVVLDQNKPTQAGAGQVRVCLALVPKAYLDPLLEQLRVLPGEVCAVTVPRFDNVAEEVAVALPGLNLLPTKPRSKQQRSSRRLDALLLLLVSVLLLSIVVVPGMQLERANTVLSDRLQALRVQVKEINQMRQDLQHYQTGLQLLVEQKRNEVHVLQLMTALSKALPDNTWLEELWIEKNQVQMRGQSETASSILAVLESSAYFSQVRFASPLTQNSANQYERFHIVATRVPKGGSGG